MVPDDSSSGGLLGRVEYDASGGATAYIRAGVRPLSLSSPKLARLVPQPEGTQPEEVMHVSSFSLVRRGTSLLLVKRSRPERLAGKWCLPAAILMFGEDPASGVRRVIKEQLGVAASAARLLDVQSYGDKHWDMCFVYDVETPGEGKLGEDFDKAEYFEVSQLPSELRDDHREVIDMAKSRRVL
jgi:ADP-ribose pyrophosphatase YjhB (NUDIX family)